MDCISSSDRKATIGLDILKSPKKGSLAVDPAASPGQSGGPGNGRAGGRGKNTKGLDIGRRAIVFVKPSAPGTPCVAPNTEHGQQVVHVIDHGETQKEAIRRIFDMQITLQACETQLVEREAEIQTLYDHVRMFLKDNDRSRLEDLVAGNLGPLVHEDELKQGPSNVEKRWVKEQAERDPDGESHIIPPWMMNDELSRRIVEELRRRVTRLATDGLLTNQAAIEHLWQCGYRFVMRWAGGPTEILQRQNADLQKRLNSLQKETLLEASMLHQHIRRLENQFKGQQALRVKTGMLSTGMSLAPSESGHFHDRTAHVELYKKDLQDDDTIQYGVRSADLEEMDHEIFEPILTFEESQREILIDMVNEKVRRILTLDPSKWNNERLPFGLRPDHLPANVQRLEEEIMMLKYELEKSEQDRSRLQALFASQLSGPNAETNGMWHKALAAMGLGGMLGERSTEEVGVQVSPKDFLRRRRDKGEGSDGELDDEGRPSKKGGAGAEGDEESKKAAMAAEIAIATKPLQERIAELEKLLEAQGGGRGGKGASKWGLLPLRLRGAAPQNALEVANEALDRQSGMLYNVLKTVSKLVGSGATSKAQKAIQQLEKQFEATMAKKPHSRQSEMPSSPPTSDPLAEMGATLASFGSTESRAPSRRAHQREEPTHLNPEDAASRKATRADPEEQAKPRDVGTSAPPPASEEQHAGGDRFLEAVLRTRRAGATLEPLEPVLPPPASPGNVAEKESSAHVSGRTTEFNQNERQKPAGTQPSPTAEQPKRAESAKEQAKPRQEQHENVPAVKQVEVAEASSTRAETKEVGEKEAPHVSSSKRDPSAATQTPPAKPLAVKVEVPEPDVEEEPEAVAAHPSPKPVERKVQLPPMVSVLAPKIPPVVAKEERHLYDQNVPIQQDDEDEEAFEVPDDFHDNLDREKTLHDWAAETLNSLNGILDGSEDAPEDSEIGRLKKTIQEQEGEISRLLLIVDELRSRLGIAKDAAFEIGGDVGSALSSVMEKAGLKDMMDGGNPLKLKGVFQRLYTDACQRVQRYCLIRAQMLAASKATDSYMKQPIGVNVTMPELEKLRQTATSALRGMWYHTDYLFQRTCAYALSQGLEASWFRPKEASVADFMPLSVGNGDDTIIVENTYDRKRPHRLPGRRGHRPKDLGDPHGFLPDDLGPGGTTLTPRQHRKAVLQDPEPTAFTTYVAGLRDARGNLKSEEWPRCAKVVAGGKPLQGSYLDSFSRKSVKAATMSTSQSLPALPKGRGPL